MLKTRPKLHDLDILIDKVPDYPVTAAELVGLAVDTGSDQGVVDFYESFPADETFTSKEDLITRTEQIVILDEQEKDQPYEHWQAPEED